MRRRGNDLPRVPKRESLATQKRQYAYIQEVAKTPDGQGGFTEEWVNTSVNKHSMAITALTADQKLEFASINVNATHLIKIDADIPVSELNQILYGVREFEILTVEDIQERGILNWVFTKERRS